MITAQITDIQNINERVQIWFTLSNSVVEINTFMPEVTKEEIFNYVQERVKYLNSIDANVESLKKDLVKKEITEKATLEEVINDEVSK
jgi:hypothetical protein